MVRESEFDSRVGLITKSCHRLVTVATLRPSTVCFDARRRARLRQLATHKRFSNKFDFKCLQFPDFFQLTDKCLRLVDVLCDYLEKIAKFNFKYRIEYWQVFNC